MGGVGEGVPVGGSVGRGDGANVGGGVGEGVGGAGVGAGLGAAVGGVGRGVGANLQPTDVGRHRQYTLCCSEPHIARSLFQYGRQISPMNGSLSHI